jgi:chromosome segregation ATPase
MIQREYSGGFMAKFTITLPDSIAKKLSADVADQGAPRSTLIARYIEQHYDDANQPLIDYKAELQALKTKHAEELIQLNEAHEAEHKKLREGSADVMQRARDEHEKRVRQISDEHEADVQQLRAECDKRAEEAKQLEDDVERLEGIMNKLNGELKEAEASKDSVVKELHNELETIKNHAKTLEKQLADDILTMQYLKQEAQESATQAQEALTQAKVAKSAAAQEAASHQVVVKGLQNELEKSTIQIKTLEDKLVTSTGIINDLKADKLSLQKQLELVTLRLPAPKVGFWARLFGTGKRGRNS